MKDDLKDMGKGKILFGDSGNEKFIHAFKLTEGSVASAFIKEISDSGESPELINKINSGELDIATQGIVRDGNNIPFLPVALLDKDGSPIGIHPLYFEDICRVSLKQILTNQEYSKEIYEKGDDLFGGENWKINYYLSETILYKDENKESKPIESNYILTLILKGELNVDDEAHL